jgi:hypothetical protein
MRKLFSIVYLLMFVFSLAACSTTQKSVNSPEQQRKNAKEAQDELSVDVNRGMK